jgi:hypothetical protein
MLIVSTFQYSTVHWIERRPAGRQINGIMDPLHIPEDLKLCYEFTFIDCFAVCHDCGNEPAFGSEAAIECCV